MQRRAALHAALADPARLAVVDALDFGDASPSELQRLLGIPSNLLAHHLNVLEREGVISRSRSEGDRRRTYLRIRPGALHNLVRSDQHRSPRVVFVCTQNSARSQLAAALWRRVSDVPAASAGTNPADRIDPGAIAVAARRRLPLRRVRPLSVNDVVRERDYVVTVCDAAHEALGDAALTHWSVADPAPATDDHAFDIAFDDLARRVAGLAPHLVLA